MNPNTNSGLLEDLIRSMTQLCALELHSKTQCEKLEYELQVSDDHNVQQVIDDLAKAEENLSKIASQRRTAMRLIAELTPNNNPTKWCEVKHISMAMVTAFEVFQVNVSNPSTAYYYYQVNRLFIETISDWLGLEIPPCASCFEDALKGVLE